MSAVSADVEQSVIETNMAWKCYATIIRTSTIRNIRCLALSNQVTHKLQLMRYQVYTMLMVVGH